MKFKYHILGVMLGASLGINAQVTPQTPDEELLEGKDTEKMFKVAKPSARLYMELEGLKEPVRIRFEDNMIFLYTDVDYKKRDKVIEAFNQATGNKSEVKVIVNKTEKQQ